MGTRWKTFKKIALYGTIHTYRYLTQVQRGERKKKEKKINQMQMTEYLVTGT